MRNRGMGTLSAFYIVYFIYMGFSTFASRYFAQIGLSESQIGVLTSVPALVAMCFMPMWGALADRVRLKKLLLAALTAGSGVSFLLVDACTDFTRLGQAGATKFWPLLALLMLNCFFGQSVMPNATSIAIEYTQSIGKSYGPIRMLGTVGYQAGALLIGLICAHSLRYLYTWQALAIFAAALIALTLPRVGGHQYGGEKISPLRVLKEKRCRFLLAMVFIGTCTSMFYQSFFGAFTQQMGLSNTMTSVITWISVALEIPMLYFAQRMMRWRSIWQWVLIGYVVTGLRWLGFFPGRPNEQRGDAHCGADSGGDGAGLLRVFAVAVSGLHCCAGIILLGADDSQPYQLWRRPFFRGPAGRVRQPEDRHGDHVRHLRRAAAGSGGGVLPRLQRNEE